MLVAALNSRVTDSSIEQGLPMPIVEKDRTGYIAS